MSSCLFVNFGRQQAFSLYYFGCGMQQAFYQNPSVRKTLLSFVWWKPGEFTRFSPSFHQVLAFTKISPGFANSPGFHQVLEITRCSPSFWKFTRSFTRFWKFTRFSKCTRFSGKPLLFWWNLEVQNASLFLFGENLVKTRWIHQVSPDFGNSPGIGNSPGFSPSFHQVLEIHQVFTKFSPGFQVFYQA